MKTRSVKYMRLKGRMSGITHKEEGYTFHISKHTQRTFRKMFAGSKPIDFSTVRWVMPSNGFDTEIIPPIDYWEHVAVPSHLFGQKEVINLSASRCALPKEPEEWRNAFFPQFIKE